MNKQRLLSSEAAMAIYAAVEDINSFGFEQISEEDLSDDQLEYLLKGAFDEVSDERFIEMVGA